MEDRQGLAPSPAVPTRWGRLNRAAGSLRVRYALLMGGFGVLMGVFMASVIGWRLEEGLRQAALGRIQARADELATHLEQSLESRQREVALLASWLGSTRPQDVDLTRRALQRVRDHQPAYAWIGVVDDSGSVRAATDRLLEGQNVAGRPWYVAGRQGSFFGDPHEAVLLAPWFPPNERGEPPRFVDVAERMDDIQGRPIGVVGAHLHASWLLDLVREVTLRHAESPFEAIVVDHHGTLLFKPPGVSATTLQAYEQAQARPGGLRYLSAQATRNRAHGAAVLGWKIFVREREDRVFEPVTAHRRFMAFLTPLLATLFALGTWFIAGRAVEPVVRLARNARRHAALAGDVGDETHVLDAALEHLARQDRLTGLANRASLTARLMDIGSRQEVGLAALVLVDLDDFSTYNNSHGREAGDQLLRRVAAHLQGLVRQHDLVARPGGGEFALVLEHLHDGPEAAHQATSEVARRIGTALQTGTTPTNTPSPTASIGVVIFQVGAVDADAVLKDAELAVREAKRQGGHRIEFFQPDLHARFDEQVRLQRELRAALPDQIMLLYQPQVDGQGNILGAEVLVRWRHPERGLVSPADFIPLAERTGLIVPLGQSVLEAACRQLRAWRHDPMTRHLSLSVNVSAREFAERDYVSSVRALLQRTEVDPRHLKLELTESALAEDVDDVVAKMRDLQALGIGLSIDDFGTGFSSLSYLRHMPLDQLKIDRSFVHELSKGQGATAIVRAIVALGQGLNMSVIAEGVETQAQAATLEALGCTYYQGYLFGRPMPVDALVDLLGQPERRAAVSRDGSLVGSGGNWSG